MIEEEKNPYLVQLIRKMCEVINVDYNTIDFQEDEWYDKHTWTEEQENEYIVWMSEELFNNEAMREELLENPEKSIMNCFHAAVHFVANFGWDTLGDIVDNIEENKVK
jgi:hypothetical protein